VTGKTHEFLFSPSDTAYFVAQHVFDNWPGGKKTLLLLSFTISYNFRSGFFYETSVLKFFQNLFPD
jgi:hypothetical protein